MVATTIYSVTINITIITIIIYYTSSQHKLKNIHRVPKKGDTKLMVVTLLTLKFSTNFQTFFTVWFSSKFAAKYLLKTPPHLICVTTLPCENFTSEDEQHSQTTHTFNGPLSRTTRVSRYQKGKTNLDFTEARDSEWQSVPRSRQRTTPAPHHSVFYRPDALPAAQPRASKHWRQTNAIINDKLQGTVVTYLRRIFFQIGAYLAIAKRWNVSYTFIDF